MRRPTAEIVAIILAIGINLALLMLTTAILWLAFASDPVNNTRPFEPSRVVAITTVLTGWGGGILGILGGYVGYTFGVGIERRRQDQQ